MFGKNRARACGKHRLVKIINLSPVATQQVTNRNSFELKLESQPTSLEGSRMADLSPEESGSSSLPHSITDTVQSKTEMLIKSFEREFGHVVGSVETLIRATKKHGWTAEVEESIQKVYATKYSVHISITSSI